MDHPEKAENALRAEELTHEIVQSPDPGDCRLPDASVSPGPGPGSGSRRRERPRASISSILVRRYLGREARMRGKGALRVNR